MTREQIGQMARKIYRNAQIDEVLPMERYKILIKPDYHTASWRFHNGSHVVVIGEAIFNNMADASNQKDCEAYLTAYLMHEFAHSIWTERDILTTNQLLREEVLPFQLYNLFEDARIEELMRKHRRKIFNWFQHEKHGLPTSPVEIFFYLLQSEHTREEMLRLKRELSGELQDQLNRVFRYYKAVLDSPSSHELIPLMKSWMNEFPETISHIATFSEVMELDGEEGCSYSDYLFMNEAELLITPEAFEALIEGLEDVLEERTVRSTAYGKRGRFKPLHNSDKESSLLADQPIPIAIDQQQANALYLQIEQLFQAPCRYEASTIPANRINVKRLARNDGKIFKRRNKIRQHKKRITVILDLSGSMEGVIKDMRLLVEVVNRLVLKDVIECTLILSQELFQAEYQVLPMPLHPCVIERIGQCNGGEGLKNTMDQNLEILKRSDYVWIFTDGCIGGGLLPKTYYHRHGIRTHAMYIGDTSHELYGVILDEIRQEMERWFDEIICKTDVAGLAEEVFKLVKE